MFYKVLNTGAVPYISKMIFRMSEERKQSHITYLNPAPEPRCCWSNSPPPARSKAVVFASDRLCCKYQMLVPPLPQLVFTNDAINCIHVGKNHIAQKQFEFTSQPFTSSSTPPRWIYRERQRSMGTEQTHSLSLDDVTWASCQSFHGLKHSMHGVSDV